VNGTTRDSMGPKPTPTVALRCNVVGVAQDAAGENIKQGEWQRSTIRGTRPADGHGTGMARLGAALSWAVLSVTGA
jgi:hypothetical protein